MQYKTQLVFKDLTYHLIKFIINQFIYYYIKLYDFYRFPFAAFRELL